MRRWLAVFLVVGFTCFSPAHSQFGLGKLKKAFDKVRGISELEISEEDEIALGEAVSERIRQRFGVQQDLEATFYITLTGTVLAEKSSRPHLRFRFIILNSNAINAFAAPGGFIHVTRGALASIQSEAELAGVLGHEIIHITEKHTIQGIQKLKGIELAEGQTSLTGNSQVFQAVVEKATEAILQGFGRAEELDADLLGLRLAAEAGYAPQGLAAFLKTLKERNKASESRSGLFASHPETDERIAKLEKLALEVGPPVAVASGSQERYRLFIKYEYQEPTEEEALLEGARGVAGSKKSDSEEKEGEGEGGKKKSRFSLARLKNPLASGEKKESSEVTGAGAGRAVGDEEEEEDSDQPKNPSPVEVEITPERRREVQERGQPPLAQNDAPGLVNHAGLLELSKRASSGSVGPGRRKQGYAALLHSDPIGAK